MVCLMVLPAVLDGAPRRGLAARKRSRPPGCVHHTLACGPAAARTRVLRAKGSTRTHDLLKVTTAANFLELRKDEVRRIPLLGTSVNKPLVGSARVQAAISHDVRRRIHSPIITTPASASGITPQ